MVTASARGWGSGWPDCQRDRCVWITAGGIRLLVRAEVAPIFKGFCDELVQRGYPLGNVADDWGFACRPIRGTTSTPSNHSWGLAIDLNSTANPMGSTLITDFPAWAVEMGEKKYGLFWGGRYASRPDAMHWEWLGTPQSAAWLIAALSALPASEQPPEPPPQETTDMGYGTVYRASDGTIAFAAPGIWEPTNNPDKANFFVATADQPVAVECNALQWDWARDLALSARVPLDADALAQRIASAVDGLDVAEVKAAVKAALREGSG